MTKVLNLFKQKYHFFLLSILTGILVGTSYIPFPPWALVFCYIPLWIAVLKEDEKNSSLKLVFAFAWISQFVLSIIGFNWIYYTAREFGHLPAVISFAALLLFALFANLYIPISITLAIWVKRKLQLKQTATIFTIALFMSLSERIWPGIFEWNLGYTLLWIESPLFQWADVVGVLGLSTIIFLTQASLTYCYFQRKKAPILIGSMAVVIALSYWGGVQKKDDWSKTDKQVQFLIVQGNIGNEEKLMSEKGGQYARFVVEKYISLTNQHIENAKQINPEYKPDVIVWPETALPLALDKYYMHQSLHRLVQNNITQWNSHLVTGAYSSDLVKKDHLGNNILRNAVFFLGPNGEAAPAYYKSELLVFGEYMPFGEQFPFLYKLLPFVGTFEKGPGPVGKDIPISSEENLTLGPQICYESLKPSFSRGLSLKNSDIIFNLTNDSWFGDWAEPYQHMTMTMARAVEVRKPLVRSTNTGISSVILANGQMLEQSKINTEWVGAYTIPYQQSPTQSFYTLYGHWDWVLILIALACLFWKGKQTKNEK